MNHLYILKRFQSLLPEINLKRLGIYRPHIMFNKFFTFANALDFSIFSAYVSGNLMCSLEISQRNSIKFTKFLFAAEIVILKRFATSL